MLWFSFGSFDFPHIIRERERDSLAGVSGWCIMRWRRGPSIVVFPSSVLVWMMLIILGQSMPGIFLRIVWLLWKVLTVFFSILDGRERQILD